MKTLYKFQGIYCDDKGYQFDLMKGCASNQQCAMIKGDTCKCQHEECRIEKVHIIEIDERDLDEEVTR